MGTLPDSLLLGLGFAMGWSGFGNSDPSRIQALVVPNPPCPIFFSFIYIFVSFV